MSLLNKAAKLSGESHHGGFHPLLYHMLDVAAVVEELWDSALTYSVRAQLADEFQLPEALAKDLGRPSWGTS